MLHNDNNGIYTSIGPIPKTMVLNTTLMAKTAETFEINLTNLLGLLQIDNVNRTIIFPCSSTYSHIIVVYFFRIFL